MRPVLANLVIDPGMIVLWIGATIVIAVVGALAVGKLATWLTGSKGRGSSWLPIGVALLVFLVFGMGVIPVGSNGVPVAVVAALAAALLVAVAQRALMPDDWVPTADQETPEPR